MMKEKMLVTSATGHVGFPAACELLSLGFEVRAFVRNPNASNAKKIRGPWCRTIRRRPE